MKELSFTALAWSAPSIAELVPVAVIRAVRAEISTRVKELAAGNMQLELEDAFHWPDGEMIDRADDGASMLRVIVAVDDAWLAAFEAKPEVEEALFQGDLSIGDVDEETLE